MREIRLLIIVGLLALAVSMVGCTLIGGQTVETEQPAEVPGTSEPIFELATGAEIRQWATSASASSEYSTDEWSAEHATGAPDTERCGDYQTAWATAASDSVSTLVLTYTQPVYPQAVRVYQSFNPDQVSQIRVFGEENQAGTVYEAEPEQVDQPCPFILTVPVNGIDFRINRLEVTVDQSVLGLGWNQIDAVELIGEINQ